MADGWHLLPSASSARDILPAVVCSIIMAPDLTTPALGAVIAGGIGAAGPVRPLFEPAAAGVPAEPDDPEITVFLADRVTVADLGPDHSRGPVDREDLRGQGEDLA